MRLLTMPVQASPPEARTANDSMRRKVRGLSYAFGLQQMAASMFCDDFQARANREPQQRNEGVPVTNAVHIVVACSPGQVSGSPVTAKKGFQNDRFSLLGGFYLLGCAGP